MRSNTLWMSNCVLLLAAVVTCGCAHAPNQWVEDGPATTADWETPTTKDIMANYTASGVREHDWEPSRFVGDSGAVTHWPLYFEDPFVDKGHGREGMDKYRFGWEDYVAALYCYSRFTLNWIAFPVSAVVTPPWTLMESDGRLSRQALGYDHDATRATKRD
jgi:hypothetical protein